MKTRKEMLDWAAQYDILKYPPHLYDELVVTGKAHPDKYILMGAWKTGAIKTSAGGSTYTDDLGNGYAFTKRWASHTPVGQDTWTYIAGAISTLTEQVPSAFPADEPQIVRDLAGRNGFGYIWALFTLHCINPKVYPLYDQHVYRAFKYTISNGLENPSLATNTWAAYSEYRNFFLDLLKNHELDFQIADRAVWTYGKSLKVHKKDKAKEQVPVSKIAPATSSDDWVHIFTLGGKAKSFWWQVADNGDVNIRRNSVGEKTEVIKESDLIRILDYVQEQEWVKLANSVSKLGDGSEHEGVGKFIYEHFESNTTYAQLSSHLCALLTESGIFMHNGKKKGMEFKFDGDSGWQEDLKSFYTKVIHDVE